MENIFCVNRVAFTLGGYDIYWYGIIMCLSMIVAIFLASLYCKKKKLDANLPLNMAIFVIPCGILCARLFACLFDDSLSILDFFNFRTGGMSIIGALVGGLVSLIVYFLIKKEKNIFLYFDVICSVLLLSQAIGRWGNFFNEELYGRVIEESSFFAKFPFAIYKDGIYYQALFFYEFVLNLIGFAGLSVIYFKEKNYGYVTASYLIYYGTVRTILEPLRQNEYILRFNGIAISRLFSISMIVIGAGVLIFLIIKSKKGRNYGKTKRNN